jgi:hypothetical protein
LTRAEAGRKDAYIPDVVGGCYKEQRNRTAFSLEAWLGAFLQRHPRQTIDGTTADLLSSSRGVFGSTAGC